MIYINATIPKILFLLKIFAGSNTYNKCSTAADGNNKARMMDRFTQRIIVIEDDLELSEELREAFERVGHRAIIVNDSTAFNFHSINPGDVILLDLALPNVDGFDVLGRLPGGPESPNIILISGYGEDILQSASVVATYKNLFVLGALCKPIDYADVVRLIEERKATRTADIQIAASHRQIKSALRAALKNNSLKACFQPKVFARDLAFGGAEILLPGNLPGLGVISPLSVIDAIDDDHSLLYELTFELMRQGILGCATWMGEGLSGSVGINFPLSVLVAQETIPRLQAMVESAGLVSHNITLELTEDSIYSASTEAVSTLAKLRLLGFRIALDDIGQRQSGLLQLSRLPLTEMKIDIDLLRDARKWMKAHKIFQSTIEMASRINLDVTVEGIETDEDLFLARECKSTYIQGYLISKKCEIDQLMNFIKAGRSDRLQWPAP